MLIEEKYQATNKPDVNVNLDNCDPQRSDIEEINTLKKTMFISNTKLTFKNSGKSIQTTNDTGINSKSKACSIQ